MSTHHLTHRQQQILDLIQDHLQQYQRPPTQAEITSAMGFSSRTATRDHLRALERKGVLHLEAGASRGIALSSPTTSPHMLPLIGQVAAGQPILAIENVLSEHAIDHKLFTPRADYLLKVRGLSMRDAGINDGDLLAVHQTPQANNGQIVVARLDDEVTVKRFHRQGKRVRLLPENSDFSPIEIDLDEQELHIEGLMVGLIRQTP
ncbi:MAG: transcriptional repressor LexA [Oceanococcus sp.]